MNNVLVQLPGESETDAQTPACQLVDGRSATRREPLRLADCLARFHHEAHWQECDTGRYRCRYVVWGEGPPLVWIPGLCDEAESFLLPMARLSQGFRCLAYNLPTGRGDGACLRRYRHRDLVDDLFRLMDHAQIATAALVGVSFGSTVALAALHQQPQRFARGILQCGFARRPLAWSEVLLASLARWWPGTLEQLPFRRQLLTAALTSGFAPAHSDVLRYYLDQHGRQRIAAVAQRAWLLHQVDLRPILPEIAQQVLLICGDRDPLVGKACEQDLLRGLPNVIRAEIENCGHLPHFTHPEVLCDIIHRFLQDTAQVVPGGCSG
ncbi:MAG: alpha/beta hydrolase [Gemmataceae bacterium]|nr:alpha/beta hydrolase [Gemmataceae bacterium]